MRWAMFSVIMALLLIVGSKALNIAFDRASRNPIATVAVPADSIVDHPTLTPDQLATVAPPRGVATLTTRELDQLQHYTTMQDRSDLQVRIAATLTPDQAAAIGQPPAQTSAIPALGQIMSIIITLAVMGSGLWVILSKRYDDSTQKWAYGALGGIVGFWLTGTPLPPVR